MPQIEVVATPGNIYKGYLGYGATSLRTVHKASRVSLKCSSEKVAAPPGSCQVVVRRDLHVPSCVTCHSNQRCQSSGQIASDPGMTCKLPLDQRVRDFKQSPSYAVQRIDIKSTQKPCRLLAGALAVHVVDGGGGGAVTAAALAWDYDLVLATFQQLSTQWSRSSRGDVEGAPLLQVP